MQVGNQPSPEKRLLTAVARTASKAVRVLNTPVPLPDAIMSAERRASVIFGEGARRMSSPGFVEKQLGIGHAFPILCPRCGGPTRRVHRKPIDRALSIVVKVWRFRCVNNDCGWEDPVRMKPHHFYSAQ